MINTIVTLIFGLVLIYLEFYLPGAVMGTAGGLMLIGSVFLFAITTNSAWMTGLYLLFVIGLSIALIKYALWRIPRVKADRSIYSADSQTGYVASAYDEKAIGKTGVVLSDLKPGGYIVIDGVQHQAISESGYIPQGKRVIVLRGEGESLIVSKADGPVDE